MTEIIEAFAWEILATILLTVFTIIGYQAKTIYTRYINTQEKQNTVGYVVECIEQIAKSRCWNSQEKKAEAVSRVIAILNSKGINVSMLEADTMIEAAVRGFNAGFNEAATVNVIEKDVEEAKTYAELLKNVLQEVKEND